MFALDPLHVGTGRQQLSRIDLPLVREKGTGLPVIPGTSLSGSCRAYAALALNRPLSCAGKGGEGGDGHCGGCAVCFSFGYSKGTENKSRQGLVQISTAQILFFPICSSQGPVWITCSEQLLAAGLTPGDLNLNCEGFRVLSNGKLSPLSSLRELDLAWAYLPSAGAMIDCKNWACFASAEDVTEGKKSLPSLTRRIPRAVLVSDSLFYDLIDGNTEVRTLVSINPKTGAAEDGALFTYEAIPRSTLFWFDVVYSNPRNYDVCYPADDKNTAGKAVELSELQDTLEKGFTLMKYLGLGGMNTRGLGRVEISAY
jgi:CRISPR-associated protein Cmr4